MTRTSGIGILFAMTCIVLPLTAQRLGDLHAGLQRIGYPAAEQQVGGAPGGLQPTIAMPATSRAPEFVPDPLAVVGSLIGSGIHRK
jgi:hypothetical protein